MTLATVERNCALPDVTKKQARDVASSIIDYCVWQLGKSKFADDEHTASAMADAYMGRHDWIVDSSDELTESDVTVVAVGAKILGMAWNGQPKCECVKGEFNRINELRGNGRLVRMRLDLLFDVLKRGMPWREFAILAAIYSGIGDQPFRRLSFEWIGQLALGFGSQVEFNESESSGLCLARHRIRYTVNKLAERRLFTVQPIHRRQNAYSSRLSADLLVDAVAHKIANKRAMSTYAAKLDRLKTRVSVHAAKKATGVPGGTYTLEALNGVHSPTRSFVR